MKEILTGNKFERCVKELKLDANKTYEETQGEHQIWAITDDSFEKLFSINEKEWDEDNWGWVRYEEGTNLALSEPRYIFRFRNCDKVLKAWYNDGKLYEEAEWWIEDAIKDGEEEQPIDSIKEMLLKEKSYDNLTDYCAVEWGASLEKNICAITSGLARLNGMSLSELWSVYQG